MKLHLWLPTVSTLALFSLGTPLYGHEDHKPAQEHGSGEAAPASSVGGAWAAIQKAMATVEGMIVSGDLKAIHEQEEIISANLTYLAKNSSMVEGDKKKRLDAALKQALTVSGALHEASDNGGKEKTQAEFKKLSGALKLIEAQYPADALTAKTAATTCPVSGKALGSMGEPVKHSYDTGHSKGEVLLCCAGCIGKFDKDPAKYVSGHEASGHSGGTHAHGATEPTITATATTPAPLQAGKKTTVTVKLADKNGKPVILDDLKESHTEKVHLLIVDASLTDYHHEHPKLSAPGEYSFTFTPEKPGSYYLWADLHPLATDKQEYAQTMIEGSGIPEPIPSKQAVYSASTDGLKFDLSFDKDVIKAGDAALGKVVITQDGKPFTQLEPVMGAFAHIVGFSDDMKTIAHVHPMGKEPTSSDERGGPELEFHLEPEKAGFLKLFVQVRKDGKDVFAPLAVSVQ